MQAPDETTDNLDVEDIRAFYDEVYHAGARAEGGVLAKHYRKLFGRLHMRAGDAVLDVACGIGGWLQHCHQAGCSVAGVDLSERAIAVCRQELPDGEFYAQPAETLPFADNRFDVVSCLGSLEHFVDPVSSLREMVRVARPDATFVILVPNRDFLTRKLGLFAGTYQVDAREVVRSLEGWESLFASAGLKVEERWRDLHVLNRHWIMRGNPLAWPLRALQALLLAVWPLRWQYQVYHRCSPAKAESSSGG